MGDVRLGTAKNGMADAVCHEALCAGLCPWMMAQISPRSKATSDLTCCQNTTAAFSRVRTLDKKYLSRQLFQVRQQDLPNC